VKAISNQDFKEKITIIYFFTIERTLNDDY
jgi:hypothetical protein